MPERPVTSAEVRNYIREATGVIRRDPVSFRSNCGEINVTYIINPATTGQTIRCDKRVPGGTREICGQPGVAVQHWVNDVPRDQFISVYCEGHAPDSVKTE